MMKGWASIITRSILIRKPEACLSKPVRVKTGNLFISNIVMDPEKTFAGKSVIITGAGQGIGYEIARQLVLQGARVILNDQDAELAARAADKIRESVGGYTPENAEELSKTERKAAGSDEGGICLAMGGDASDMDFIGRLVDRAVGEFGQLDIVIANAGITLFGDFLSYTPESFFRVMQVNLGGSFFLAQAAARQMKKQGTGGSILFTSSVTGHQAHKNLAAYGMSKAALEMLARNLVIELSPYRITVNAIAPGATLTERTADDAGYEKTWSAITPMGRPASTPDIAHAALFLVSPLARHITGQTLVIDGGWTATSPSPF
jgi:NAD(P)-dependent dehydrogenase (short-subunit alcohol dehydrogenase family)